MFRFITDSVSGVLPSQQDALNIASIVPSYVRFGDDSYRENVDMSAAEFQARLKSDPRFPTTSAPSVGEFAEVFERFKTDDIVCVNVSRELSGTVTAAENAAAMIEGGRIAVIDSRSASAGQLLLLQAAQRMAAAGLSLAEVKSGVEALTSKVKVHIVVDTLENLRRGGRIGGAQALIGGLLQFKPLLTVKNGRLEPLERVRTYGKAVARLVEISSADLKGRVKPNYIVIHAAAGAAASQLAVDLAGILKTDVPMTIEVGASVAAHIGPGALGVAYLND